MYALVIISIILFLYFLYKGYDNTKSLTINHIHIDKNNTTKRSSPLRILHISDLHIENISITPSMILDKTKNHPIDLIALTGDFLDRKTSIPKLVPYLQAFQSLQPTHGIFAVFGNHDYVLKKRYFYELKKVFKTYQIKTLQNENELIYINGEQINVIGIDNFSTKHSDLKQSYEGISEGFNLVLTHDPNVVLNMQDYHFDYLLSGHFHGGQIHWPKPYHLLKMGKLVRMNMVKGLHQYKGKLFYISEGLGQTGINIRIGSRPEITVHHLHVQQQRANGMNVG